MSAGVVENNSAALTKTVAVRIEPHGAIRIVGGDAATAPKNVRVRLDGITFTPYSTLVSSRGGEPYRMPSVRDGVYLNPESDHTSSAMPVPEA